MGRETWSWSIGWSSWRRSRARVDAELAATICEFVHELIDHTDTHTPEPPIHDTTIHDAPAAQAEPQPLLRTEIELIARGPSP